MTETAFEKLLDESLTTLNFEQGALISGVIVDLTSDWVTVHVGLKSESLIPRTEFLADEADGELSIGDEVKVSLEAVEDGTPYRVTCPTHNSKKVPSGHTAHPGVASPAQSEHHPQPWRETIRGGTLHRPTALQRHD